MNYNKLQQEAINSNDKKIVVVAPPGAGKTATLVGAISRYVDENPFKKVVAITFTKKAASELHLKLAAYPQVEAATIHSWSLRELNKIGAKHGFKPSILQDVQIQEILQLLCKQLGYYSINYYLLTAFVMGNYNIDITDGTKARFKKVLDAYISYKRSNGLYDFTDLPLYLYDMLTEYDERITTIDALFVDEFQDVDGTQAVIFTMVDAEKHFYIGDPDQAIYIFRGAEAKVLDELEGFTKLRLEENYRSYQPIIDYATILRSGITDNPLEIRKLEPSWIRCVRTDDEGEVYILDDEGNGHDLVHDKSIGGFRLIEDFMEKKPYILCRSNKQVKEIQNLGYRNVSTIHQAKGLQYSDVVYMAMPLAGEEETNIAYVACTRAQNSLLIADYTAFVEIMKDILQEDEHAFTPQKLF